MAASLKGIDPKLKMYLKVHRMPDVYEALLSGLAIMCPPDPHQFIIDKLTFIKEHGYDDLEWDSFIDPECRPPRNLITESNLDYIFNFDENSQPTPEMYERAYSHYNNKLMRMGFNAFVQHHLYRKRKRAIYLAQREKADRHYKHRILQTVLTQWHQWLLFRLHRQEMAHNKLQQVYEKTIGRVIFKAWHNVTLDAKRTREYFERINRQKNGDHEDGNAEFDLDDNMGLESWTTMIARLERGENVEDEDLFGMGGGEARDDISSMPKKVAVQIFSFVDITDLARCACVCRSWKIITQSSMLWSSLDFTRVRYRKGKTLFVAGVNVKWGGDKDVGYEKDWVTDKVAMKLLGKCRPYLVHLNLRCCKKITEMSFMSIRGCRNLQDINLSECTAVNDDTLKFIVEGCKILLYLNVSYTDITDASMRVISKNCVNLQYLSIAYCIKFTDKGVGYLATGKTGAKINYLDLSGCNQLTPAAYRSISAGFKFLQTLIMRDIFTLDDICIGALLESPKKLKHLNLIGTSNLTDEAFKLLATNNRGLTKLKLDSNQRLSDTSFKMLTKANPDLRLLSMTECMTITDTSLKALATCRFLTVLNLADCVRVTDQGVRYIMESPIGPRLKELNLTNCIRVGDLALVQIHKRCNNLAYLNVSYCEHISEAGIELLGSTNSLTSLDITGCSCGDQALSSLGNNKRFMDLNLSECVEITDLGLQKFAQQCTEIEALDLSHLQNVTDGAIKNLAFSCRLITKLNLAGCKRLTDLSVQYLCGVCHHMQVLDISGCIHVTDKSLKYLKRGCKNMQSLTMYYCGNISKHAAQKLQKNIPEVVYSNDPVPDYYNY